MENEFPYARAQEKAIFLGDKLNNIAFQMHVFSAWGHLKNVKHTV